MKQEKCLCEMYEDYAAYRRVCFQWDGETMVAFGDPTGCKRIFTIEKEPISFLDCSIELVKYADSMFKSI